MPLADVIPRLAGVLRPRRLRAQGIVLALCTWGLYVASLSTPGLRYGHGLVKGTDFVHFYTLGSLALEHRGSVLYDTVAQERLAEQFVPGASGLYYVALYGPQVSLFFAPFAWFSYGWALVAWWTVSTLLYGVSCYAVWRCCARLLGHGFTVLILAVAYPAFFHLIAWGQTSAPALLCFALALLSLRAQKEFLAGVVLGLLAFKPQLGLAAAVVFVVAGQWKVVGGAILSASLQIAVGWLYYGTDVMRDYLRALQNVPSLYSYLEPRPYTVHSLRAFWAMLLRWPDVAFALYVLSSLMVLYATIRVWRGRAALSLRYSTLLVATVLVAPHLTVYDLVLLAPAFLLLSDWILDHADSRYFPWICALLYMSYILPLLAPITSWTHVQWSVVAFAGLLFLLWQVAQEESEPAPI
jgi:alpha-1,2-mannosyltransferase